MHKMLYKSGQRILTKGRIAREYFSLGSIYCDIDQLGALKSGLNYPFSCIHRHMPLNGPDNPKISPSHSRSQPHVRHGLWAQTSQPPNGLMIGSAVSAEHTHLTNTQTDQTTCNIYSNMSHCMVHTSRPNNCEYDTYTFETMLRSLWFNEYIVESYLCRVRFWNG